MERPLALHLTTIYTHETKRNEIHPTTQGLETKQSIKINFKTIDMLFTNKQEKKEIVHQFFAPPHPPKEVSKIQTMLCQVETWINAGETELARKHWILISDECRKYGT